MGGVASKENLVQESENIVEESLTNKLFPFWYGTAWDFNGYTSKPNDGKIACGYFVSTTLQHAGFNLNRYKLAQMHSYGIVKKLSCGDSIVSYYNTSRNEFLKKAKSKLASGLYVIGLDNHVGFLLKTSDSIFFIHSNYREPAVVVKEKASNSKALDNSRTFLLCKISRNMKLIQKWIKGEEI